MTRIEELEQKLDNAVEKFRLEMNECKKELAELKESKKECKWKPAYDEVYFYRGDNGIVTKRCCCDNQFDEWRFNNLQIFKTEEECERYWHFMDTVKEKSYEFSREEWGDISIKKFYIYYSYRTHNFEINRVLGTTAFGRIHFKSLEDAQYIIDNFKEELFKYWL